VTTKAIAAVILAAVVVVVLREVGCLLDRSGVVLCVLGVLAIVGRVVWARTGDRW
jgi:hypothetical protein